MTVSLDTDRMVRRLESLVMCETPSSDARRLREAHVLLQQWSERGLGRQGEEKVIDGVPHLVWDAPASPRVLILGHLDTVFGPGTAATRPFVVEGDRATGPGVFDMKSGLVIAFEALERAAGLSHVSMLITGDEEVGSPTSRGLVEAMARECSAVLVLEPSLDGALKTGRNGGSIYRIQFTGRAAHAGLEPENGHNALIELAHLVHWCDQVADARVGTTVTPTVAKAGDAANVVPANAEVVVDARATSLAELERVHEAMLSRRTVDPGVDVVVQGGVNRPPMEEHQSQSLVELASEIATRSGLEPVRTASVGGASDGNFTAALGIPTLDGLGPIGGGAHGLDEWVQLSSLESRVRLVAGLIDALSEGG